MYVLIESSETHATSASPRSFLNGGDFAAKLFFKSKSVPYQIIDHKELWVGRKTETELGFPCVVWTNGRNMVQFFDESFREAWNNRHAISVYPEKESTKLK
jgi:hypothetical protein